MIELVGIGLLLLVANAVGLKWGADSRDGRDWQPHRLRGQSRRGASSPR